MLHTQFAERAARRLEAVADRLEEEGQWLKLDTVSARAKELRVAAHLVRNEAAAVTQEEENSRGRARVTASSIGRALKKIAGGGKLGRIVRRIFPIDSEVISVREGPGQEEAARRYSDAYG